MTEESTPKQENRLRQLFDAYLLGELSDVDQEELIRGLESPEGEALIESVMTRDVTVPPPAESAAIKDAVTKWLDSRLSATARVRPMRRWRYAAAAAVILCLAGTYTYFFMTTKQGGNAIAQRYKNDLAPGRDKAVLKLADGKIVELNDKTSGNIPNQDGATISEQEGWVRYGESKDVRYNDVYTPIGAQIKIDLADGTRVWLDAASSMHFPTAFPSGDREVTITGQAYFEVAPNSHQVFVVHAKGQTIRVLGTHFNVNAYGTRAVPVKTTLEQGSVMVASGDIALLLKPGQQADGMVVRPDADLDEILAWKNGEFRFNGAGINVIMEQLSRWYGAEIVYKDQIREEFVAKIRRDVPVSKVLSYLEATGQVRFTIDGNKITVMK